ncbi:hypothetical protein K5I29_09115 [Flavobacterium agricola]|uniref:Lipoprotein n=1 Tax=Flavobacterium agricola TaxID=2870839 RepID=A0ABY6M0H3_9FLAO|nr:hypothetical protein [Flavobacterium agricola]UYW00688.1 hypothetical protein K5I29_09115 [Flavobacterium agricola]
MKKVVLSLAFVATLAVVSCKDANAEAQVEETPVEVVEEVVAEEVAVDTAAVAVDSVEVTEVVAE